MPLTSKSSIINKPLPCNVFYIWYPELCRRSRKIPAAFTPQSCKFRSNTVLDFIADKLKYEDWEILLTALKKDTSLHVINVRSRSRDFVFLSDVDSERKASSTKRKLGALWTDFVLNWFLETLIVVMRQTRVLTSLELEKLPMFPEYLETLLSALKGNTTLRNLSLKGCSIRDSGCKSVCLCLQLLPNIENLNLTKCDLTSSSGISVAKFIKFQQLNRYATSWHKSLRYSEPDAEAMRGIKRITLNCNPDIGDEGLKHILGVLADDLWLKALDMQKCGITENISRRLFEVLIYNTSLRILDFRNNDGLSIDTLNEIFVILKTRDLQELKDVQFNWYGTEPTTSCISSTYRSVGTLTNRTISTSRIVNRKNKTESVIFNGVKVDGKVENPKKMHLLNNNLNQASHGSKNVLKPKMKMSNLQYSDGTIEINHTLQTVMRSLDKFTSEKLAGKRIYKEKVTSSPSPMKPDAKKNVGKRVGNITEPKNGYTYEDFHAKTGIGPNVSAANSVGNLFAQYCKMKSKKATNKDYEYSDNDEATLLNFFTKSDSVPYLDEEIIVETLKRDDMSDSQVSLFDYMQELQQDITSKTNCSILNSGARNRRKKKKNGMK